MPNLPLELRMTGQLTDKKNVGQIGQCPIEEAGESARYNECEDQQILAKEVNLTKVKAGERKRKEAIMAHKSHRRHEASAETERTAPR